MKNIAFQIETRCNSVPGENLSRLSHSRHRQRYTTQMIGSAITQQRINAHRLGGGITSRQVSVRRNHPALSGDTKTDPPGDTKTDPLLYT
jgi:hypothetical protein